MPPVGADGTPDAEPRRGGARHEQGQVLGAGRFDMTIKADSAGSRIFALDVPLHIAGDLRD
jgi:hypothetical protein